MQHIDGTGTLARLVVLDDVLSPPALAGLLAFAQQATVWHEAKNGYLGAYFDEGWNCPLLLQVGAFS